MEENKLMPMYIQELFGKELIREGMKGLTQYSYTEHGYLVTYFESPLAPRFNSQEDYINYVKCESRLMCYTLLDRNFIRQSIISESQYADAYKKYDFNKETKEYNLGDTYLLVFNIFQYAKYIENEMKLLSPNPKDGERKVSHPNFRFVFRFGLELLQDKYNNYLQ